jgi:hypothetical protein
MIGGVGHGVSPSDKANQLRTAFVPMSFQSSLLPVYEAKGLATREMTRTQNPLGPKTKYSSAQRARRR